MSVCSHVEYLHQLGALTVDDLDALVANPRLPASDVDVDVTAQRVSLGGG